MKVFWTFFFIITVCISAAATLSPRFEVVLGDVKKNENSMAKITVTETIVAVQVSMPFEVFSDYTQQFSEFAQENDLYFSMRGDSDSIVRMPSKVVSIWMGDKLQRAKFDYSVYMIYTEEYNFLRVVFVKEGFVNQESARSFADEFVKKFFRNNGYDVENVIQMYQ